MKNSIDVSRPGHTEMHYMTRRSHLMQKRKFGVTCPFTLFLESQQMQKHKFVVMSPIALFVECILDPAEYEK
jgi:hypothetical protein